MLWLTFWQLVSNNEWVFKLLTVTWEIGVSEEVVFGSKKTK